MRGARETPRCGFYISRLLYERARGRGSVLERARSFPPLSKLHVAVFYEQITFPCARARASPLIKATGRVQRVFARLLVDRGVARLFIDTAEGDRGRGGCMAIRSLLSGEFFSRGLWLFFYIDKEK